MRTTALHPIETIPRRGVGDYQAPHTPTAEDAAEAMYAQGLLDPALEPQPQPEAPSPRDIAVPLQAAPEPVAAVAERKARAGGLQSPPDVRHPLWALKAQPTRDAGFMALFPEREAEVTAFWTWLLATRSQTAARAAKGYAFISTNARTTKEDTDLYEQLLCWVAWCDLALWLLTQWYEQPGAGPRPRSLTMPFIGFEGAPRQPYRLVREPSGLTDEMVLEEVLEVWRVEALATGYLTDVGLPTAPEEEVVGVAPSWSGVQRG
ncbi:MAG TPA: hypothetical protein VNM48_02610 [Chloroflexota bacterium]|nr:hypothetical protein [Chloroflexota bacterium]